jgi:hypothetical protein
MRLRRGYLPRVVRNGTDEGAAVSGIFNLVCPGCGRDVRGVDAEHWICVGCGRTYLLGVGHLIPVGEAVGLSDEASVDDLSTAGS